LFSFGIKYKAIIEIIDNKSKIITEVIFPKYSKLSAKAKGAIAVTTLI
jgi:hypothetical protein